MIYLIKLLLGLPLAVRVAMELMIIILLWRVLGRGILWILSLIPFLMDKLFILIYQVIEWPITMLHKKIGAGLHNIENIMARFGDKVHGLLRKWYDFWHKNYHFRWKWGILFCLLCWSVIVLPSLFSIENNVLNAGERFYLYNEDKGIEWMEKHFPSDSEQAAIVNETEQAASDKKEIVNSEIALVVYGVSSSLLVRDIPNMEGCVTLDRLYNGDKVVWTGELVFAETNNNRLETWVKVITSSGAEGWSRLNYLHPENYEGSVYHVKEMEGD